MRRALAALAVLAALPHLAGPAKALDLSLPGNPTLSRELREDYTTYFVPVGPWQVGAIPKVEVEGGLIQQAWRLEAQGLTTLQMMAPLRDQVQQAGYTVLFDCAGQECGGFDFRFNTRVMPAPDMFVDLFDYRFLSARRGDGNEQTDYVTLLASRAGGTGYVQVIQVFPGGTTGQEVNVEAGQSVERPARPGPAAPLDRALVEKGHVVLSDLEFETGSSSLGPGPFASLDALAAFLRDDPARRVALVGHTDTVGGLESNVALSRRRAASVLERLVSDYDIPRGQLEAGGMGYLSPLASNLTPEGRETNRRVEAVLLNTE